MNCLVLQIFHGIPVELTRELTFEDMPSLQRRSESLMGRDSYLEDQWNYFRADLRAKDYEGLTDMDLMMMGTSVPSR